MTNMVIYLIGTLLVVAGLAYGANRLGVSQVWIVAGALVIIGIGLMGGIVKTRQKDPASVGRLISVGGRPRLDPVRDRRGRSRQRIGASLRLETDCGRRFELVTASLEIEALTG